MTYARSAEPVSILRLVPVAGWSPDAPLLDILVDGEKFLEQNRAGGSRPQSAGALLNPPALGEPCPLEPVPLGRHVALAVDSCGEEGCGVTAPFVVSEGASVVWRDFVDVTAWFVAALGPEDAHLPDHAMRLPIRPVRFDAEQYLAEVRRLTEDRSWESPAAAAARRVQDVLWRARSRDRVEDVRVRVRPSVGEGLLARWSGKDSVGLWYRDATLLVECDEPDASIAELHHELERSGFRAVMEARAGELTRTR